MIDWGRVYSNHRCRQQPICVVSTQHASAVSWRLAGNANVTAVWFASWVEFALLALCSWDLGCCCVYICHVVLLVISCQGADSAGCIRACRHVPLCFVLLVGVAAAYESLPSAVAKFCRAKGQAG